MPHGPSVTAAIRALPGERDLTVGIVACLQTHGARANWHPHRHLRVTDGGLRPDGTGVSWPAHDTARMTEAFRRSVLPSYVRLPLFDAEQAAGMLPWPPSGFHVQTGIWVSEDDRAFATRLALYCARHPVALEWRTDDRAAKAVTYRADTSEGPMPGTATVAPLACPACHGAMRLVACITPDVRPIPNRARLKFLSRGPHRPRAHPGIGVSDGGFGRFVRVS